MTKTFTDESGNEWQANQKTLCGYYIEPIPAPPQTEAEILAEMDRELRKLPYHMNGTEEWYAMIGKLARTIIKACGKIAEVK